MKVKTFLPILPALLLGTVSFARTQEIWSYDRLTKGADLIVIATPVYVRDTPEKTTFRGIERVDANNVHSPIPAIGVETTFEVLSILKGVANSKTLLFHHLREAEKQPCCDLDDLGPGLVAFDPKGKKRFLLFLKRELDGRYASVTGQTDPYKGVKDLGTDP